MSVIGICINIVYYFKAATLVKLEEENQDAAEKLRTLVARGEQELAQIQQALVDIAEAQLAARKIEVTLSVKILSNGNNNF